MFWIVQHVLIMRFFPVNIKQLFLLRKPKQDNGYIKKIFKKKIKISDNTTRDLTKGCDCMKKKSIIVICVVLVISGVATVLVLTGNRGNVSNVKRVVGYSALYGENSINEAFDVIEKKFAKDFEGCTLTELRYDEDVENRFAEEIEKYHKENNQ